MQQSNGGSRRLKLKMGLRWWCSSGAMTQSWWQSRVEYEDGVATGIHALVVRHRSHGGYRGSQFLGFFIFNFFWAEFLTN